MDEEKEENLNIIEEKSEKKGKDYFSTSLIILSIIVIGLIIIFSLFRFY